MFKKVKSSIAMLKSAFAIASIGLSTFVTTSCSKTKNENNENKESKIDPESAIIHINGITDNNNCRVDSSLFSIGSSYKFNELNSDIVLGVNELKNCDVTELTITISSKSTKPIEIKIENGQQTSDKKYDGITFQVEEETQEFEGKVFSKILRLKKDTLKKIINDLNCQTNDVNISFAFNKVEKESNAKTKIYVGLWQNDDQVLRDEFRGARLNDQDDNWYKEGEHEVAIDELSSITVAYNEGNDIAWASDDQQFFIRKVFENEFDEEKPIFIDESIKYNKPPKTEDNVTTFELKDKIPVLGDVYLTNIHSEYIQPNADDYYTIDDGSHTIYLLDETVELDVGATDDNNTSIKGFYFEGQNKKQEVEYDREGFDSIVNVGKNVTSIGDNFLDSCPNIEYVNFINGFDNIHSVGMNFMSECKNLKCIQINGENDNVLIIGSDDSDTITEIGASFLFFCPSFNQEIKVINKTKIAGHFLVDCYNFNSNVTFESLVVGSSSVDMFSFMYECRNMTSTITINALSKVKQLDDIFLDFNDKTLSVGSNTDNSYKEGIKIDGKSAEHINAFMSLVPNSDSGPYYRKLVSAK